MFLFQWAEMEVKKMLEGAFRNLNLHSNCIQLKYFFNITSKYEVFCPICLLYAYKMYHESWKWLKFNGKRFIWTISWILWLLISTFYFNKLWCLFFVKKLFKKVKRLCLSNLKHLNNNLLLINSVDL